MEKIKSIIIDDEELGRRIIREFLAAHPDIDISAECPDAISALEAIDKHQPDLLFLDIQMPEVNGFELLEMLENLPLVVFSTAYDQYALKAFDVNAVDYLLKPFDQERFNTAMERVKGLIQHRQNESEKIRNLIKNIQSEKKHVDRILVKKRGKMFILSLGDVLWIEAVGDYVNIHTKDDSFLLLKTMKELETRLNPNRFIRLHRSSIIHLEAIKEIVQWTKGRWKVYLEDGQSVVISRSGAQKLKKFMI